MFYSKNLKRIKSLQGNFEKKPTKSEILSGHVISFRRAIYSTKMLKAGKNLSNKFLVCLRPNVGLDSRDLKSSIGKKIKKNTLKKMFLVQSNIMSKQKNT